MQKRLHDVGWPDDKKCKGSNEAEGTEKHSLYHCPCWKVTRSQIAEKVRRREQKNNNMKDILEVAKRCHDVFFFS